jgi:hypothetical protein
MTDPVYFDDTSAGPTGKRANELPRFDCHSISRPSPTLSAMRAGHRSLEGDRLFPFRLRSPYSAAHEVVVDDLPFTAADVVLDEGPPLRLVGLPGGQWM